MPSKLKIYTRTGDKGLTSLYGGRRVSKGDPQVEAYGTVDELNAVLGLLVSELVEEKELMDFVQEIQADLFSLGTHLAGGKIGLGFIGKRVAGMEKLIDRFDKSLPELKNFILPGGTKASSASHFARTLARRAERKIVAFKGNGPFPDEKVVVYLNRLSDFLFVAARFINSTNGKKDIIWKNPA